MTSVISTVDTDWVIRTISAFCTTSDMPARMSVATVIGMMFEPQTVGLLSGSVR